jgi:hypothetical protein
MFETDTDTSTEGPLSLQELERRLSKGEISKNTRVRMPDGAEWMLLPSSTRSEPAAFDQIRRLKRLRRGTAYGSVRWVVKCVAWLCYASAVDLVFFERFSGWLPTGGGALHPEFNVRLQAALLLGLVGWLLNAVGAMLVDLFDLLLAKHDCQCGSLAKPQADAADGGGGA